MKLLIDPYDDDDMPSGRLGQTPAQASGQIDHGQDIPAQVDDAAHIIGNVRQQSRRRPCPDFPDGHDIDARSEEQTSELQSLMRISYAVFCLKKTKILIK